MATDTPPLIGLYSSTPRMGKSTAAEEFTRRLWPRVCVHSFASPLKLATAAFLEAVGLTDTEASRYVFDGKDTPIPNLNGKTARDFLVKIGTDVGREFIRPTIWVEGTMGKVTTARRNGFAVVIDDVRNEDEFDAIKAAGGHMVRVTGTARGIGPRFEPDPKTEGRLDDHKFLAFLNNTGGKMDLIREVARVTVLVRKKAAA